MKSGICLVILVLLISKLENYNGLRIKSEYDSYMSSPEASLSSSTGNLSSEIFDDKTGKKSGKSSYGVSSSVSTDYQSDYSQVDKEDEDEDVGEDINVVKSEGTENENSERSIKKGKIKVEEGAEVGDSGGVDSLSRVQYDAKQSRFDLSGTVYPRSDVSGTNYVFLSPAAQKKIDKKIVQLRKKGKHHGSMKETIAVGEWQRRYYSRPVTEVPQFRDVSTDNIYSKREGSLFNWVMLALVTILVMVVFVFIYRSMNKR
ncbi:hypothetical protein FG379_001220 [Cryptosporidium bovis]|uniref:uncharacterized protein n=1 Tax=Cryptosporidium bovis TaxID=310047 RepID=UPI003519F7A2|nr:hypothetical protein FG379_001220 [Cryptosporidium bovis]